MRKLIAITTLLISTVAFAGNDYQAAAEKKFNSLSAVEALKAGFEMQTGNIHMPGTSTWYSPLYELCVNGKTIQTKTPKSYCVAWKSSKDGEAKVFNSKIKAEDYGNTVTCVEKSAPAYVSSPISYQDEVCAVWSAKNKDGDVKTFTSVIAAKKYSKNDSATCVAEKVVTKTMPTTFKVDFYRNKVASSNYLGTHTYSLPACNGK